MQKLKTVSKYVMIPKVGMTRQTHRVPADEAARMVEEEGYHYVQKKVFKYGRSGEPVYIQPKGRRKNKVIRAYRNEGVKRRTKARRSYKPAERIMPRKRGHKEPVTKGVLVRDIAEGLSGVTIHRFGQQIEQL